MCCDRTSTAVCFHSGSCLWKKGCEDIDILLESFNCDTEESDRNGKK